MMTTIPKDIENPLKILSAEKVNEVKIHMRSMGKPVKVDKEGIVRAVKVIVDEEGEETYQNLSYSKIPESVREALIILVPEAKNAEGLRFKSEVIDLSKFKKGGCLYVNLVPTKIRVTLGDFKTVVKPGEMEFINALSNKDQAAKVVDFHYENPKDDKDVKDDKEEWKPMISGKMALYKSRREICIFYYSEQIKNVDFRGIPFITPPAAKPIGKPK
jgi:hypothetical protein